MESPDPTESSLLSKMEDGYRARSESRMRVLSLGMKYVGTFYSQTPIHENPLSGITPVPGEVRGYSESPPPLPSMPPMPQTMESKTDALPQPPSPALTMSDAGTPPVDACPPTPYRDVTPTESLRSQTPSPLAASSVAEVPQPLPPPPPHVAKLAEVHGALNGNNLKHPHSELEAAPQPFSPSVNGAHNNKQLISDPHFGQAFSREISTGEPPVHNTETPKPHPSPRHNVTPIVNEIKQPAKENSFQLPDPPRIGRRHSGKDDPEREFKALKPPKKVTHSSPMVEIPEKENLEETPHQNIHIDQSEPIPVTAVEVEETVTVAPPVISRAAAAAAAIRNEISEVKKAASTHQVSTQTPTTSATQTDILNSDMNNLLASSPTLNRSYITPPHTPVSATVETQTPTRRSSLSRRRGSHGEKSEPPEKEPAKENENDRDEEEEEEKEEPKEGEEAASTAVESKKKKKESFRKKRRDKTKEATKKESSDEPNEKEGGEPKGVPPPVVASPLEGSSDSSDTVECSDSDAGKATDDLFTPLPSVESPCSSVSSVDSSHSFPSLPQNEKDISIHENIFIKNPKADPDSWVSAKVVSLHKGTPWVVTDRLPYATTFHDVKEDA